MSNEVDIIKNYREKRKLLCNSISEYIIDLINCNKTKFRELHSFDSYSFTTKENNFRIQVNYEIDQLCSFKIKLICLNSVAFAGHGPIEIYKKLDSVELMVSVQICQELIAIEDFFDEICNYINREIDNINRDIYSANLLNEENDISRVYRLFRSKFNSYVASKIVLYEIYNGTGIYYIDRDSLDFIFPKFKKSSTLYKGDSFELLISFLNKKLSFDKTFSKEAVNIRKPLIVNISESKYKEGRFEIAEHQIIGGDGVCVHPIFYSDDRYILASYPAELHSEIFVSIQKLIGEIERILKDGWKKRIYLFLDKVEENISPEYQWDGVTIKGPILKKIVKYSLDATRKTVDKL